MANHTAAENPDPRPGIRASVIIPALNEERFIGECLKSLVRLRSPGEGPLEVIVVDNGSTDKTPEIVESFRQVIDIRLIRKPDVSVSAVRNFGASCAGGEVVAFLDADCVVPEEWLVNACAQLEAPGCGLVGAFYLLPAGSSWVAKTWAHHLSHVPDGEVSYVGSHNMVLRRSVFHRIGGFDEKLQTNEDYDFCQRIAAAGLKVLARRAAAVVHLGTPQTLGDFFRRERWHGRHVMKVFLRDTSKLHNARAVLFAWFTLAAVAAMLAGIAGTVATGTPALVWGPAAALLMASLVLSAWYTRRSRAWEQVPGLTVLFLAWGLARAAAVIDLSVPSTTRPRKWQPKTE